MASTLIAPSTGRRVRGPRRQWLVIIPLAIAFGAGGALFSFLRTADYSSTALVQIDQSEVALNGSNAEVDSQDIATQTLVVSSAAVTDLVISALDLDESTRAVQNAVRVTPVSDSRVLRITVTWDSPDGAATVANAFAKQYLEYRTDERDQRLAAVASSTSADESDPLLAAPVGQILSPGLAMRSPAGQSPPVIIVLSVLLGGLVGLVLVFATEAWQRARLEESR